MPLARILVAVKRLLILRALKLGDLVCAIPALRALAHAFPGHERVLAAPAWLEPLVRVIDAGEGRAIDRLVPAAELEPLPRELHDCALAANLHGRGPQSHRVLLATRPRNALWFANPQVPASAGGPPWRADEHEVQRWCRMLAAYGVAADPADIRLRLPTSGERARGVTLIHPGASSPARQWPLQRFAAVAHAERRRGRKVLVTGTRGEAELARRLAETAGLPAGAVIAGRTDLLELAATVAGAGRLVCGDTGVAHLAFALCTPAVVLFGPTSPAHWGPPPAEGHSIHRVLWAGHAGDPHASKPDPGLLELEPDQVIAALAQLP